MHRFPTPAPTTLRVDLASGSIAIDTVDGGETTIELAPLCQGDDAAAELVARARVEQVGDAVVVSVPTTSGTLRRVPEVELVARVPTGSSVDIRTKSADVTSTGELARFDSTTASGDIRVQHVTGTVEIRTASGDVSIRRVDADAQVQSASGSVSIAAALGPVTVGTASGDIDVTRAGGPVTATTASGDIRLGELAAGADGRTASGDIEVRTARCGPLQLNSASGDVRVGVPAGTLAWLDVASMSGDVSSTLDPTDGPDGDSPTLEVRVRTMSGDVGVRRVGQPAEPARS